MGVAGGSGVGSESESESESDGGSWGGSVGGPAVGGIGVGVNAVVLRTLTGGSQSVWPMLNKIPSKQLTC